MSPYLLTYFYKYEHLTCLGRIGEHVQKPNSHPTAISKEVEHIMAAHFSKHAYVIDKKTFSAHRTFQFALNHPKDSVLFEKFGPVDHTNFNSYYCILLVAIRNIFSHQPLELLSLKEDIDRCFIPNVEELLETLKRSIVIQSNFSSFSFYSK